MSQDQPIPNTIDQPETPATDAPSDTATPSEEAEPDTVNAATPNELPVSTGAPPLNLNHAGDMLTSDPEVGRQRLILGSLPKGLKRVERATNAFRSALEEAVLLIHGEIDFEAALAINAAARWERHAQLAQKWLRDHCETMEHTDRLKYSTEIAKASDSRDKAVARLKLGADDRKRLIMEIVTPPAS